ncbi:SigE family RNA polymerase sigma factor [Knoellia subterranea]|uniref:RNA polymerase n=1 Tax=Knoellia subterranea KCTC 19937 TaxID=1385521 RepID=A0A0A0JRT8_9MICO|nr:SigE family RNA polymerase sigma factor [Knoellia subterranea]KGN39409.1 RNA polymerase [Knoellia subterranea KCTC 19937]
MAGKHDDEFTAFATGAAPRLLRTAWMICGNPTDAEDLVQSAMVKVYLRWGRLRTREPLAYARRCILNDNIDTHRRRKRESPVGDFPEREHLDSEPEDTARLVSLLGQLPPRERQVVVLRHYVGLPESEVADLLDVSVGTVKSSGSRGLARLREALTAQDLKEGHHA